MRPMKAYDSINLIKKCSEKVKLKRGMRKPVEKWIKILGGKLEDLWLVVKLLAYDQLV